MRTNDSAMKSTARCRAKRRSVLVLLRQRRHAHGDAGQREALVVRHRAALDHEAEDVGALDRDHGERDLAVVDQQPVAHAGVVGQALVGGGHPVGGARDVVDGDADLAAGGPVTGPSANVPSRIFGPCRSARTATARPVRSEASRTSR